MKSPYLTCHNLSAAYDSKILFQNLSFTIHSGERWGIVGPNGAGKSTLFKMIKGVVEPIEGSISIQNNVRTTFIDQKINYNDQLTVEQILRENLPFEYDSDKQLKIIEQEIESITHLFEQSPSGQENTKLLNKLTQLHTQMAEMQGAPTNNIIQSALTLGVLTDLADRRFSQLSGGQQKRVQIIASLLQNPNLILLDEPTNHLDIQTVEWLEEFLLKIAEEGFSSFGFKAEHEEPKPVAILIISHDRALLDTLVNKIFEIEHGESKKYDGNYESYNEQKLQYLLTEEKTRAKMANTMRRELEWLRDGVRARTTKQTARIKRAHELDEKLQIKNQKANIKRASDLLFKATMTAEQPDQDGSLISAVQTLGQQDLIKFDHVGILHPAGHSNEKLICNNLSFLLKPKLRIALLGPNGCGKSTILKYISNQIAPYKGKIKYHELSKITYFDQKREQLNYDESVRNNIESSNDQVYFNGKHIHILSYLDRFLFSRYDANQKVSSLSGGEQARLLLAKLMLQESNVLVMDEPTNDLDIPTLQILEKNLIDFKGGVIFTSHDRYFMQRVATSLLTYTGEKDGIGQWTMFADLNQALDHLEKLEQTQKEQTAKASKNVAKSIASQNNTIQNQDQPPNLRDNEKKSSRNMRAMELIEKQIEKLENQINEINLQLETMYAEQKPYEITQPLIQKLTVLNQDLNQAYEKLDKML